MKRRSVLKSIGAAGAALLPASVLPAKARESDAHRLILFAAQNSPRFEVISDTKIRRRVPSWRDFLWSEEYQAFVSDTWDGHFGYHWMLATINGNLLEIPAGFAQVHQWHVK